MKSINRLLLTLLVATSASAFAASNIASVNGIGIPQNVFNLEVQRAIKSGATDTPELREAIKRQMIANILLFQEAQKQQLDKAPEVVRIVDNTKRQAMIDLYIAKTIKPQPVTDSAVKEEYDSFKSRLGSQEYRLRVIQATSEANAQTALKQIKTGQDFAQVAQKTSVSPSDSTLVSFKTPAQEGNTNGLPLPVAQVIEKMKAGDVSSVISAGGIWWVLKVEAIRPTKTPHFDEIKNEIKQALNARAIDNAIAAKLESLYKQAKIQ